MTRVIHLASPRAGVRKTKGRMATVQTSARYAALLGVKAMPVQHAPTDPAARQAAIENALSMALYFVRQPGHTAANLWAATARANRACTLLKQASECAANVASATGRA